MIIQRLESPSDRTNGTIFLPGETLEHKTVENPWLNNQTFISCIPAGFYKFKRDTHGKHQWFSILDVVDRTFIEIHEGSHPDHSDGCICTNTACLKGMMYFYGDVNLTYVLEIRDPWIY
jgi:hypothetical protein